MPAIEAFGLARSFGGRRACWDLTFSVARGEVFGLLGPNGAGKTTTLRLLAGLITPDAGSANVAGCAIAANTPSTPELRAKIGLLTEQPGFYDRLTARENLVYAGRLQSLARTDCESRARRLLDRFALASHADRPFSILSRGMKQKLAIARALLHDPEVIFLDEPTVGLDPEATREVRTIVAELASEKRTIVLCTHHLDEVERLCARAAFVAGRLLAVHDVKPLTAGHRRVRIELAEPLAAAEAALRRLQGVTDIRVEGRSLLVELAAPGSDADPAPDPVPAPGSDADADANADANADGAPRVLIASPDPISTYVPEVLAALISLGARVCTVTPERDPLERAWVQLLAQARAEGLIDSLDGALPIADARLPEARP